MKYKSINFITHNLLEIINKETENYIQKICNDNNTDYDIIKKKYLNEQSTQNIKNNLINILNSEIRCLGIIKSGCQCARTRKNNSEFCLIHQKSLKFGKKYVIQPNVDSPE